MELLYKNIDGVPYHQKGENPRLVIHSGTHGDEYHVIEPLKKVVSAMYATLPSFIFVPAVSPSAVQLGNRENKNGHDLNRNFGTSLDEEVLANKKIALLSHDAVAISFHEDLEFDEFYFYDSSEFPENMLHWIRHEMSELKVPLRTGLDDPRDPDLSTFISRGYADSFSIPDEQGTFLENWAMAKGAYKRFLTFEIPHNHGRIYDIIQVCVELALKLVD